jgi:hypothetical protein
MNDLNEFKIWKNMFKSTKIKNDKIKTNRIMTYEEVTDKTNDIVTNGIKKVYISRKV